MIILIGLGAIIVAVACRNIGGMTIRSRLAWNVEAQREIARARLKAVDRQVELTSGTYWGPLTPQMADRVSLDDQWIIDPYNLDLPESKWLYGPEYGTDRGWPVRIKGNPFWIYVEDQQFLAIVGRGVDGELELTQEHLAAMVEESPEAVENVIACLYDPTNGTFSQGDIISVVPDVFFSYFERIRNSRRRGSIWDASPPRAEGSDVQP